MAAWPLVSLDSVTTQIRDSVKVEANGEYKLLGVRWYAQGAFLRETVTAQTSKATTLYRASSTQFIYNRLFAWKGSFGLVTEELDGCYVSNEFPLFKCDRTQLEPDYLVYVFSQSAVWKEVESVSTGTTASRNRWKETQFNSFQIPLPSIGEQRRIVKTMASVDALVDALRAEIDGITTTYANSLSLLWTNGSGQEPDRRPLSDVMVLNRDRVKVDPATTYQIAGVLNAGKGLIDREAIRGSDTSYDSLNRLSSGQVVMRRLTAWEGPITVVPPKFDGYYASGEFPTFTLTDDLSGEYFTHVCRTQRLLDEMRNRVTGSVQRRKRLNPDQLLAVRLPIPSIAHQRKIGEALTSVYDQRSALNEELATLNRVRAELLTALISQTITVDEALDQFNEAAA